MTTRVPGHHRELTGRGAWALPFYRDASRHVFAGHPRVGAGRRVAQVDEVIFDADPAVMRRAEDAIALFTENVLAAAAHGARILLLTPDKPAADGLIAHLAGELRDGTTSWRLRGRLQLLEVGAGTLAGLVLAFSSRSAIVNGRGHGLEFDRVVFVDDPTVEARRGLTPSLLARRGVFYSRNLDAIGRVDEDG